MTHPYETFLGVMYGCVHFAPLNDAVQRSLAFIMAGLSYRENRVDHLSIPFSYALVRFGVTVSEMVC